MDKWMNADIKDAQSDCAKDEVSGCSANPGSCTVCKGNGCVAKACTGYVGFSHNYYEHHPPHIFLHAILCINPSLSILGNVVSMSNHRLLRCLDVILAGNHFFPSTFGRKGAHCCTVR
jgi:hypothetical protein